MIVAPITLRLHPLFHTVMGWQGVPVEELLEKDKAVAPSRELKG